MLIFKLKKCFFLQEKELKAKAKLGEIKDNIISKWEEKSREIIGGFLDMFGRDGRLVGLYRSYFPVDDNDDNNEDSNDESEKI